MKRMTRLTFVIATALLALPVYGQDLGGGGFGGDSIDVTNIFNGRGNGGRGGPGGFGRGGPQIPDSYSLYGDIKSDLKKGKTPLEKDQEKPLQAMLDMEVVALADQIQVLRTNNGSNNAGFPGAGADRNGGVGRGGGTDNLQASELAKTFAIQMDTIATLKNDDFLDSKLSLFLSPEQAALIQKTHADDKTNATCLDGMLDRYSSQIQSAGRGNNRNQNRGNFDALFNPGNSATRPNGQKYCMSQNATPSDRLEPIRKVLAEGNIPLEKDKEAIAEIVMKSELQDLDSALRAGVAGGGASGYRGNFINNRNNDPQLLIQSSTDNIYKKVAAMLKPAQAETLKRAYYKEILGRGGIETLIGIEAMKDTPLTDDQMVMVATAWPELQSQVEKTARQDKKKASQKDIDSTALNKLLEMLEPQQITSFEAATKKYGVEGSGN